MIELDYRSVDWPASSLDAANHFHREIVPQVRETLDPDSAFWREAGEVPQALDAAILVLPPADHTHAAWRLAAVQELAREAAPARINAVVGLADEDVAEAVDYLRDAPGVTGQVLTVDAIAGKND